MGKIYSSLLLAFLVVATQAAGAWKTDFEAAKQEAKKENKAMLLDFTGSDWCPPCMQLKKAVFDKPEWQKFAEKNLVVVELDFPKRKKLAPELQKRNESLSKQYKVEGFPSILFLSSEGKELGRLVGYDGESPAEYIQKVKEILAKGKSAASK